MQNKPLSERIEHIEGMAACYGHNELSEAVDIAKQALRDLEVAQEQIKALRETDKEGCRYMVKQKAENQALLADISFLQDKINLCEKEKEVRDLQIQIYQVRPLAEKGDKLRNKNEALEAKVKELEGKVEIAKSALICLRYGTLPEKFANKSLNIYEDYQYFAGAALDKL